MNARTLPSRSGAPTTPNAKRKRPMGTITMSPLAWKKLERLAHHANKSRGEYVEWLLNWRA